MAARPKASVCACSLAGIVGSNSAGGMDVCLLWVTMLSRRVLCDEPITRPEEPYQVCLCMCLYVTECDQMQQ